MDMAELVFWLIVGFIILDFLFEGILDYLNLRHMKDELPEGLEGIYDKEKYAKSQQYSKVNIHFSTLTGSLSLVTIMIILFTGGFGWFYGFVGQLFSNAYLQTIIFFGTIGFASDMLSLPFQIYRTFFIEERFGFNKTTPRTFIADKLKSYLLAIITGGGILLFVQWAWLTAGVWFFIIVFGGMIAFMVFMAMFYTRIIVPLFNKLSPLEAGELRDEIFTFTTHTGFKLDNIFIIDGSKRSTKANAYFSGFGPKKRIVFYDTLIKELKIDEIVAVLAHEIGHYKKKHMVKGMMISGIQSALFIWLLYLSVDIPALSLALGGDEASFALGIVAFGLLISPLSFITGTISNKISRRHEYQADHFAKELNQGKSLRTALIRLSVTNLSNLTPHPAYVFFHYSHPTLLQRLAKLAG